MSRLQKQIDKNQSTADIEKLIFVFKQYRKDAKRMPDTVRNFFIQVDHIEVKQKTIMQAGMWLDILGNSLKDIATKSLNLIIRDTNEYRK